jgi:type VI secretion system protein ImpL
LELSQKEELHEFRISEAAGRNAPAIFTRASGNPLNQGVPGLYSYSGFYDVFLPESKNLAKKMGEESWVLGKHFQIPTDTELINIQNEVLNLYFDDFRLHWHALLADIRITPFANLVQASEILNILSGNNSPLTKLLTAVEQETNLNKVPASENQLKTPELKKLINKNKLKFAVGNSPKVSSEIIQPYAHTITNQFRDLNQLVQNNNGASPPIENTLALLNELYLFLNSLTKASGKELALEHQKQISNVIQKVSTSAKSQPFPVNEMLNSIANNSSSLISGGICQHLNATWRSEVLSFCRAAIKNRYPITNNTKREITLEDFGLFFGPDGKIDTFFKTYLENSVDKSRTIWRSTNTNNSPNCLSRSSLAQFKLADTIKNVFFRYGGQHTSFGFAVRPVSMSTSITQMNLDIDGQILGYAHGPVQMKPMKWPGPNQSGQVSLQFLPALPGASTGSRISMDGPWALFRLINEGEILKTSNSNQFIVKFNIQGREATLELRANSAINPFNIKEIKKFRCLAHL